MIRKFCPLPRPLSRERARGGLALRARCPLAVKGGPEGPEEGEMEVGTGTQSALMHSRPVHHAEALGQRAQALVQRPEFNARRYPR